MSDTQLPAEVSKQIKADAKAYSHQRDKDLEGKKYIHKRTCSYFGYTHGATPYAVKLLEAQQEIERLKVWKREASTLLDPILNYGQSKEANIPLGESIIDKVLERCKRHDKAQAIIKEAEDFTKGIVAFIGQTEKSENLLTEIKTFLDGK